MKITKKQLEKLIKEAVETKLNEESRPENQKYLELSATKKTLTNVLKSLMNKSKVDGPTQMKILNLFKTIGDDSLKAGFEIGKIVAERESSDGLN